MINVLVRLEVKNFSALGLFEQQAVEIMAKHGGRLLAAFETKREPDGSGEEIHILEFPNETAFAKYRADSSLSSLGSLRNEAVSSTEVKVSSCVKSYA